jgi:hypothetical protein
MTKEEPVINYYQNVDRKFTILHLEIRKFDSIDIISIVLYAIAVTANLITAVYFPKNKIISEIIISGVISNFVITTAFGLRFRNIYFSAIWLLLSIFFLINGSSLSRMPILMFILYHILRLLFWKNYNKEFIPYTAVRGALLRYVSKTEGRGGYKEDRTYMKILLFFGFIIFMVCLCGLIGKKI